MAKGNGKGRPANSLDRDTFSADETPGTPRGVVRVDDTGIVRTADPVAAGLIGHAVAALTGKDFFRDLLPSANVPRGRGRFLAGVRRGHLDAGGRFALDRATGPVWLDLRMISGKAANGAWIELSPFDEVSHRKGIEGAAAVERR